MKGWITLTSNITGKKWTIKISHIKMFTDNHIDCGDGTLDVIESREDIEKLIIQNNEIC